MMRMIAGVVLGYVAMAVVVFVLLSAGFVLMGADRAFKAASWEPSPTWIFFMFAVGFVAALIGGRLAARIAGQFQAAKWLAVVILALGIVMALCTLSVAPPKEPRTANLGVMEAMNNARTPLWVALANPVIGVAGVWVGGKRRTSAATKPID